VLAAFAVVVSFLAIGASRAADRAQKEAVRAQNEAENTKQEALRADQEAVRAQSEARQAHNATRMAAARELEADPTTVLALLREVEPPDVPRGWSELTRWALYAGIARVVLTHPDSVLYAESSPDGKRIAIASGDKTARVWSADGRGEPLVLRGHENDVCTAAWSPDGKRILTTPQDRTVRVWNADGSGEPMVLRGAAGPYNRAAFSPDGKRIAAASDDKTVSVWTDLEPLRGAQDPKLWTATTYCMPIERRIKLLNVPESTARAHQDDCLRRVKAARAIAR
jgi:hypothetical protein